MRITCTNCYGTSCPLQFERFTDNEENSLDEFDYWPFDWTGLRIGSILDFLERITGLEVCCMGMGTYALYDMLWGCTRSFGWYSGCINWQSGGPGVGCSKGRAVIYIAVRLFFRIGGRLSMHHLCGIRGHFFVHVTRRLA